MNSKAEFHQAPLVRVVTVVWLEEEQGERQGGEGLAEDGWQRLTSDGSVLTGRRLSAQLQILLFLFCYVFHFQFPIFDC